MECKTSFWATASIDYLFKQESQSSQRGSVSVQDSTAPSLQLLYVCRMNVCGPDTQLLNKHISLSYATNYTYILTAPHFEKINLSYSDSTKMLF